MAKKAKPVYPGPEQILEDPFYGLEPAASATEMTGMIASAVEDEQEADAYEDIWPMHRQEPVDMHKKEFAEGQEREPLGR